MGNDTGSNSQNNPTPLNSDQPASGSTPPPNAAQSVTPAPQNQSNQSSNDLGTPTQPPTQPVTDPVIVNTTASQTAPSATPANGNVEMSTTITSPHAPQKYGGKKILATIFGLLLVVGGVISGVALVQRQQNISEQAVSPDYDAQCSAVKAYDANWNELSAVDLESLTEGAIVRFTVSGTASAGSFDKAKFNINGNLSPEVTDKKPGTEEYYYEYTIPTGETNFTVNGQIHHTVWGWI